MERDEKRKPYLSWICQEYADRVHIFPVGTDETLGEIRRGIGEAVSALSGDDLLLVPIDNRIGLSRWVERRVDDLTGDQLILGGREDETDRIGLSTRELKEILTGFKDGGFQIKFFYPYPDRDHVLDIYTDSHLPSFGFAFGNPPDDEHDRIQLLDQSKAADVFLEEGILSDFFDSAFAVIGRQLPALIHETDYVHFSDQRAPSFCTRTRIFTREGERKVLKEAAREEAGDFIRKTASSGKKLEELYEGSRLHFLPVRLLEGPVPGLEMEYRKGDSLARHLDRLLYAGKTGEALAAIKNFFSLLEEGQEIKPFHVTDAYREIFGEEAPKEDVSLPLTDVDCIFDNVYLEGEDSLLIFDYEWTVDFPLPLNFIKARALHYYLNYRPFRKKVLGRAIEEAFPLAPEEIRTYSAMEASFQAYVYRGGTRERLLRGQKRNDLLKVIYEDAKGFYEWKARLEKRRETLRPEMNVDLGIGYYLENVKKLSPAEEDGWFTVKLTWPKEAKAVRFDPAAMPGIFTIASIQDGKGKKIRPEMVGLSPAGKRSYLSLTDDPRLIIRVNDRMGEIRIRYRYDPLITQNDFTDIPPRDREELEWEQLKNELSKDHNS